MSLFKRPKKGFTLVELVITMVVLGILATTGVVFFTPLFKLFFNSPEQLQTELIANRIIDSIIDGTANNQGLGQAKIILVATPTMLQFTNAYDKPVLIEWHNDSKSIFQLTSSEARQLPFDFPNHQVKIEGQSTAEIFTYYDSLQNQLATPVTDPYRISRVEMNWIAYTRNNDQSPMKSFYRTSTGVHIKKTQD